MTDRVAIFEALVAHCFGGEHSAKDCAACRAECDHCTHLNHPGCCRCAFTNEVSQADVHRLIGGPVGRKKGAHFEDPDWKPSGSEAGRDD